MHRWLLEVDELPNALTTRRASRRPAPDDKQVSGHGSFWILNNLHQPDPRNSQGLLSKPGFAPQTRGFEQERGWTSETSDYESTPKTLTFQRDTRGFNPCFFSQVVTGKSRVHRGFVTGLAKDGKLKPRVSGLKPRVSIGKAWVVTGESRVHHGLGLLEKIDPAFSSYFENSSIKTLGYTEKNRFSMLFLGNPGFIMETRGLEHGSSETRGLQANPTKR